MKSIWNELNEAERKKTETKDKWLKNENGKSEGDREWRHNLIYS